MEISNYNYGISGQPTNEWDNFLCFGRKCKQRKAERHKLRMEKRKLKNDQQRAETESMRAETSLTKQLASPTSAPTPQMAPQMMMQQAPQPTSPAQAPAPQVQKAGMGSPVMIVIGLLVVGGLVYQSMKKKGAAAPVQTA